MVRKVRRKATAHLTAGKTARIQGGATGRVIPDQRIYKREKHMQFKVTIDFRKGPAFSMEVSAGDKSEAKIMVMNLARGCGFDGIPKKITVRPA